eukprot:9817891-Prorocentrum_lima.AAC.1
MANGVWRRFDAERLQQTAAWRTSIVWSGYAAPDRDRTVPQDSCGVQQHSLHVASNFRWIAKGLP